jgi:hypothetical protein
MSQEIINRVAQSQLMPLDLEDFYPKGIRVRFDLKDWLVDGLVLRENLFREAVKNYDWQQHKDQYVALFLFFGGHYSGLGLYAVNYAISSCMQKSHRW